MNKQSVTINIENQIFDVIKSYEETTIKIYVWRGKDFLGEKEYRLDVGMTVDSETLVKYVVKKILKERNETIKFSRPSLLDNILSIFKSFKRGIK